jgi:urocanate hydratase
MNKDNLSIVGFFGIVITLIVIGYGSKKPIYYGSHVDNEQYNKYTQKHPVIGRIKPLHPKVKNDFQMRSFVLGTSKFYGELDGLGRTPFAYAGLKANPEDQEVIKELIREVLKEELSKSKE